MLVENYHKVRSGIDNAYRRAGRQPSKVRLLPVSRAVPVDVLVESWPEFATAGCASLMGNRVQEAVAKTGAFQNAFDDKAPHVTIIGPLQTNKAGHLVSCADEFRAPDRSKVAGALQRRLADSERTLDVLIQVNASREPQKPGLAPSHATESVRTFGPDGKYSNLRLRGFMTIAAQNDPNVRKAFAKLWKLRDSLLGDSPEGVSLNELSIGTSGSYHEAIAEGATTVRVGHAIFKERPYQK